MHTLRFDNTDCWINTDLNYPVTASIFPFYEAMTQSTTTEPSWREKLEIRTWKHQQMFTSKTLSEFSFLSETCFNAIFVVSIKLSYGLKLNGIFCQWPSSFGLVFLVDRVVGVLARRQIYGCVRAARCRKPVIWIKYRPLEIPALYGTYANIKHNWNLIYTVKH